MSSINTKRIKEITNERIGYDLFLKEEEKKMKKMKKIGIVASICAIFIIGTITVDANTDGAISTPIKNAIKIKIDGKDKNATCTKLSDGSLNCKVDKSVTGNDTEVEAVIVDGNVGDIEMEYSEDDGLTTIIK